MSKWGTYELGNLVSFANGGSFPNKYQGLKNDDYDFYKVNDMNLPSNKVFMTQAKNTVSDETIKELKSKLHPKNTIIFPKVGAALLTNKRRILTKESTFDNNIMGLIPNEKVKNKYLFYYLQTIDFTKYVQIGAVPSINKSIVSALAVEMPLQLCEQQKIASILSSVDEAIEKTEQIIEQTEQVKKGLMQQLLTKGVGNNSYKNSILGDLPEEWTVSKIGNILEVAYGKDQKNVEVENGNIPILGTSGIIGWAKDYLYDKPSVLIGRKGTINKPQYISGQFWTIDTLFYTKIDENVAIPKFVYYLFQRINWQNYNEATGVPSLSSKNISNIKVSLPLKYEQKNIVNILETIESKLENDRRKLGKLQRVKQGLMQQLLTGQVRVPIDEDEEVTT